MTKLMSLVEQDLWQRGYRAGHASSSGVRDASTISVTMRWPEPKADADSDAAAVQCLCVEPHSEDGHNICMRCGGLLPSDDEVIPSAPDAIDSITVTISYRINQTDWDLIGVDYRSSGDRLTARVLRDVPIDQLVKRGLQLLKAGGSNDSNVLFSRAARAHLQPLVPLISEPPHRGKRHSEDHYRAVAFIYQEALAAGESTAQAIMTKFVVSKSTATKWVMKCRDLGLLPPTRPGKAG